MTGGLFGWNLGTELARPGEHEAQKILIAAKDDPLLGERLDEKIGMRLRFHP